MAIWQHGMRVLGIFYRVCAETAIKELPVKNLTPPFAPATSISYKTDAFPLPSDVTGYIRCFCATTSHNLLWPWPLAFWPWECFVYSASHVWPTYQFLLSYTSTGYWVTSTEYLITLPSPGTVNAHAPCHVTHHRGQKLSTFLESLNPICLLTLSLLRCYDED